MAWNVITKPCEDCGRVTTKKVRSGKDFHCAACGIERAGRAADEMYNKSGPAWDKFCESLAKRKRRHNTPRGT